MISLANNIMAFIGWVMIPIAFVAAGALVALLIIIVLVSIMANTFDV